ncbi:Uncharacterised protein [Halioglobus japonicus]|nr:Uncharacterised protein [Halioglobus japonicus]
MIDPATLAADLSETLQLTSDQVTPPMIQRQLDIIRRDADTITRNTRPTHALLDLIERNLLYFVDAKPVRLLADCTVFVIPLPLCAAYSKPPGQIVIGNGLMNIISACGYWSSLCGALPSGLAHLDPLPQFPNIPLDDALGVLLFALIYRHYQYGEPLPDFRAWQWDTPLATLDRQVVDSVAGAATFILLHELGHLVLGHHADPRAILPLDVPLAVGQSLSRYQHMEFEADRFALEALNLDHRSVHFPWINMALNFHLQRETVLGERPVDHPINLNRLYYAQTSLSDTIAGSDNAAQIAKMGAAFESLEAKNAQLRSQQRQPLMTTWERKDILQALAQIETQLGPFNLSLEPLVFAGNELADWSELSP